MPGAVLRSPRIRRDAGGFGTSSGLRSANRTGHSRVSRRSLHGGVAWTEHHVILAVYGTREGLRNRSARPSCRQRSAPAGVRVLLPRQARRPAGGAGRLIRAIGGCSGTLSGCRTLGTAASRPRPDTNDGHLKTRLEPVGTRSPIMSPIAVGAPRRFPGELPELSLGASGQRAMRGVVIVRTSEGPSRGRRHRGSVRAGH